MCGPEHVHLTDEVRIHGVEESLGATVGHVGMPSQKGMEPVVSVQQGGSMSLNAK